MQDNADRKIRAASKKKAISGKAIPVELEGIRFHSKTRCKNFFKYLLNNRDKIDKGKEFELLLQLLSIHPKAEKKIGCGVEYFTTEDSSFRFGQKFFLIHRIDGTIEDFSYMKCLGWNNDKTTALEILIPENYESI